jgi:hypothetical protein
MGRVAFSLIILGALVEPAAAAPDEWLGYACITNNPLLQACIDDGIALGECAAVRFAPPTVANGNKTRFSLFEQHWAENYFTQGSLGSSIFKPVQGVGIAAGAYFFPDPNDPAAPTPTMKLVQDPPNPVTTADKTISFTATIRNFDGAEGCNVTVRGAATLRPPHG